MNYERERQTDRHRERETVFLCVPCSQEISRLSWLDRLPETRRKKQIASERESNRKEDRKVTVISEQWTERWGEKYRWRQKRKEREGKGRNRGVCGE